MGTCVRLAGPLLEWPTVDANELASSSNSESVLIVAVSSSPQTSLSEFEDGKPTPTLDRRFFSKGACSGFSRGACRGGPRLDPRADLVTQVVLVEKLVKSPPPYMSQKGRYEL